MTRSTLVEGRNNHLATLRFNKAQAEREYQRHSVTRGWASPRRPGGSRQRESRPRQWVAPGGRAGRLGGLCRRPARQDWVLGVARRADPDPWRDRVRDPAVWRDGKALAELARAAPSAEQRRPLLLALGERLTSTGGDGIGLLRRVAEQYPDDFWANFTLARALYGAEAGRGVIAQRQPPITRRH